MIIQLEVQSDTAALIDRAQKQGFSLDPLFRSVLSQTLAIPAGMPTLTDEEWEQALQEAATLPALVSAPVLSDDAFDRESLYTREDEF